MFSSLLGSGTNRRRSRVDRQSSPADDRRRFSTFRRALPRSRTRSYTTYDEEESNSEHEEGEGDENEEDEFDEEEDEEGSDTPLLPIFASATLDLIPVFTLTHVIRELVVARCETVLSWDQLRSPQVSQFLVRPILQQITQQHFNAGTEYGLLSNCLQFSKEADMYPGNSGTSRTRAMLCELLAIRLLREYSTRELIDALSYDFDPLQGQVEPAVVTVNGGAPVIARRVPRAARVSCFEVALRAQAKRFLAHPLVVQQLEAIWAGTIVFHSAADSMHRKQPSIRQQQPSYGTTDTNKSMNFDPSMLRRAATIYNPRDASLFKLSRLRVPRYRNVLSTLSFSVLLGLFLAVLIERSLEITPLEVFFWFWAGGYMLDEIVGFTEQGFSLYIASFWNTFDLGILLLLFIHLLLRFYGIIMVDVRKHAIANMAYDILAADAILLFPRLFSVLDHYRYFSQLLIAFRMMAQDLVAILMLILISCSGFFVALTLSFGNDHLDTPGNVAYALLQILMGFTPAAWDRWTEYNTLGKIILTLFLFIAHFLIVVILITVLTNSFMAIVKNANEEHQFVFAVNTIASVKSDALFSFVAPTNIVQWSLAPLRYCLPFRQYVKVNRTIIKATHFPILFIIYAYERAFLGSSIYDSLEFVESRGRPKKTLVSQPRRLNRAPSIATFRQDRALDEVFRRVPDSIIRKQDASQDRRQTSTVVNNWMTEMGEDIENPPPEQDRKIVDRLERQKPSGQWVRSIRARQGNRRAVSVASDPEDLRYMRDMFSPGRFAIPEEVTPSHIEGPSQQTDADGDDELAATEHDDEITNMDQSVAFGDSPGMRRVSQEPRTDYFPHQGSPRARTPKRTSPVYFRKATTDGDSDTAPEKSPTRPHHQRNFSTATQIYKPERKPESGSDPAETKITQPTQPASGNISPQNKSHNSGSSAAPQGRKSPKKPTRLRPILPDQTNAAFRSAPNFAAVLPHLRQPGTANTSHSHANHNNKRNPSINNPNMDIVSDIGDNQAIGGGYVGAIPASFASQMFQANQARKQREERNGEQERISRLMMSRLTNLEESMREVIHGVRDMAHGGTPSGGNSRQRSPERLVRAVKRGDGNGGNGLSRADSTRDSRPEREKRKLDSREGIKDKGRDDGSVDGAEARTATQSPVLPESMDSSTAGLEGADKENVKPADASSGQKDEVQLPAPSLGVGFEDFATTRQERPDSSEDQEGNVGGGQSSSLI